MIRYALLCDLDHGFEAWFGASADFDDQAGRGLVECPFCASRAIRKAIMAPALHGTRREAAALEPAQDARTGFLEAARAIREHVEENFDYVGDAFAREARAIHEGESEHRGIYGEAKPEDVRALREDGIAVAPLPPAPAVPSERDLN